MTRLFLFTALLFCSPLLLFSQSIDLSKLELVRKDLDELVKPDDPGLAVGIISNGEIIFEEYRGMANLENQITVTEKSRFNIASVSKQFTALCILDLALKGKLSIDDDFRKYVPELYPEIKDTIRISHLLTHTSGIRDYCDLLAVKFKPWWRQVGFDNQDVLDLLEEQDELNFSPGSKYYYSNSNYTILTEIVSRVADKDFSDYSKDLFVQLGMKNTFFSTSYMMVMPNKAVPYADWGDGVWKVYPMLTNLHGDGFLYTTLKDQLKFEQAIQNSPTENGYLSLSQKPIPEAPIDTYGYGLELEDRLSRKAVHHSGSTGAYHAQTVRYLDNDLTIVIMSNNGTFWSGYLADDIANYLLPKHEEKKVVTKIIEDKSNPVELSVLAGDYESPGGTYVKIFEEDSKLFWKKDNNNPIEMERTTGNAFRWVVNPDVQLKFVIDDVGDYFEVHQYDEDPFNYMKKESFDPTGNDLLEFAGKYYSPELDVSIEITVSNEGELLCKHSEDEDSFTMQIIQRDALLLFNYRIRVDRDNYGTIKNLRVSNNRAQRIRFEKDWESASKERRTIRDRGVMVTNTQALVSQPGDIILTFIDENGNEKSFSRFGGDSYDKASMVQPTMDGGYIIVGSTSSFGAGNYDVWLIKTDAKGKMEWSETYGGELNEYGDSVIPTPEGYRIHGKKQVENMSEYEAWEFSVDLNGEMKE